MSRITSCSSRILLAGFLATCVGPLFAASATQSTLHSFAGGDGNRPSAQLIIGADGYFYGTAVAGGNAASGAVFKISPTDGSLTTLYSFSSGDSKNDGGSPQSSLVLASDGNYYGTTRGGGSTASSNAGTVFEINTSKNNALTTVHLFTGTDGSHSLSGLVQVGSSLYGTTADGGGNNLGTVFGISVTQTGQFTTLHNFAGGTNEGAYPMAGVIGGADGNFYGTTFSGGTNNCGTIYQLKPNGSSSTLTTLHSFSCSNVSGQDQGYPMGALVQGLDGTLYGTTTAFGLRGSGTLFSIKPDGSAFTTLYTFTGAADGVSPQSNLILGSDGNLYGTTPAVGLDNNSNGDTNGTVFSFNLGTKVLTTLWGFSTASAGINTDGWNSLSGLVQGSNGNFYGTATNGGANNDGTAYEILPTTSLPAPISIAGSPASVLLGDSSVLSWSLASKIDTGGSASFCFATGNDTNWAGSQPSSGNLQLTYKKLGTFTYGLTCGGINTALATVTVSAVPAPTGLTAVGGDGQVTLNWTAVTGAATYNVYDGTSGNTGAAPVLTGVTGTSATITGLVDGTTYYFKVSAVTSSGQEGPKSAYVTGTPTAVPAVPQGLAATPWDSEVDLAWSAASGANSYDIYESTTSGAETLVQSGVAALSYKVTGLTNGTTYYFTIASVNRTTVSAQSAEVSATPGVQAGPANLAATAKDSEVDLSWDTVTGAGSYTVLMGTTSGGETVLQSGIGTNKFKALGLTNGTTYYFTVEWVSGSHVSAPSAEVSAVPTPVPAVPSSVQASAGNGAVTVSWTAVSGATSYQIYETASSGSSVPVGTTSNTSFTVQGLTNGNTYAFNVAAVNSAGSSLPSVAVYATPEAPASGSGGAFAPGLLLMLSGLAAIRRRFRPTC